MTLSLGIDIGTSGVRTAVLDGDRVISEARASHPLQNPNSIDAEKWWSAVEECLHRQMQDLRRIGRNPREITGIAVDGTSGSMVLTDANLKPVSPALMYNSKGFDAEAATIAEHIVGTHITKGSNSALARAMRLVSLAEEKPAHLLHQADFIAAKLVGYGGFSDYNNALKTGNDPATGKWPSWIANLINPTLLPEVQGPGTPFAHVSDDSAAAFGLSATATVYAGTTDSIAAFLASAPIKDGMAVTSLGSTLAIKLLSPKRIDDPSIGLYSHRLGDLWLVGGASNTGGAVLKQHFTDAELDRLSNDIDPARPLGLDFYPLREPGERFPINDPTLAPKLTPRPDSDAAFLQAMLEGMAAIEARCYAEIQAKGGSAPKQIFTAGGGAKNAAWTAIRAHHLGQEPLTPEYSEASVGSAKLAQAR